MWSLLHERVAHFNCIALRNTLKNIRHSNLIKIALCPKKNTQKIQIHMQRNGVGPRSISFHAKRINECVIDTREDNAAYA